MLAECAVFGIEVFLPQCRRLDDVAVAVEHGKILARHLSTLGLLWAAGPDLQAGWRDRVSMDARNLSGHGELN
jgi:hypothetical protein